jgi:hypothetical protein
MRYCYICGVESQHRLIVEPRLIPVCGATACRLRATQLALWHCSARLDTGHLCGQDATALLGQREQAQCAFHLSGGGL